MTRTSASPALSVATQARYLPADKTDRASRATPSCCLRVKATLSRGVPPRWGVEVPNDVLVSDEFTTVDGLPRVLARLSTRAR